MTNLSANKARIVRATVSEVFTGPAGEAGTGGQFFRLNATTGLLEKGNASTATELGSLSGVTIEDGSFGVGDTITLALPGAVIALYNDATNSVDGLDYGASVFVSDTDASFADSAGTVSRVFGAVIPVYDSPTPDKAIRLGILGA